MNKLKTFLSRSSSKSMRLIGLLLCFASISAFSQNQLPSEYKDMNGILIDSATQQPISSAHIWTKNFRTTSTASGNFFLLIQPTDSIHISHIGFNSLIILAETIKSSTPVRILMKQKVVVLEEVSVVRMSEDDFKEKVINTKPEESEQEQNAKANIAAINHYVKSMPQMKMSASDNYTEYMKGPQGVSIFSSNGQKGLIKAIKDIVKTKPVEHKSFTKQNSHNINFNSISLKDSLNQPNKQRADSLKSLQVKK